MSAPPAQPTYSGAPAPPIGAVGTNPGPWSSGMCGCCDDCGICCYGYWCLPCLYGDNVNKLNGGSCCCNCFLYALCPCFACIFAGNTRSGLRVKYGLEPEPCGDCCVHCWCSPCGVCQEARELKKRLG